MKFIKWLIIVIVLFTCFHLSTIDTNQKFINSTCHVDIYSLPNMEGIKLLLNNKPPVPVKTGSGSGVIIAEVKDRLYILTAGHVTEHSTSVILKFPTLGIECPARLEFEVFEWPIHDERMIPGNDVAIVSIPKIEGLMPIPLDLHHSKKAFTVGFAATEQMPSWANVTINSWSKDYFIMDFNPAQGRSGSPVFSKNGVMGLVLMVRGQCISAERIQEILKENCNEVVKTDNPAYSVWTYIFITQVGFRKGIV